MILVGRLVRKLDARLLVVGLGLTALSLHMMTGVTPQMDVAPVVVPGVMQGLGLGLDFVPLSTVAFATLDAEYRADATSLFSLVRNIGSAIGIAMVTLFLTRNMQINHAELAAQLTPFDPVVRNMAQGVEAGHALLPRLDGLINQRAPTISYIDDFKLMMVVTMAAILLTLLLRCPEEGGPAPMPTE